MKNPAFAGGCAGLGLWLLVVNLLGPAGDAPVIGMVASIVAGAVCAKALQRSLLGRILWILAFGPWAVADRARRRIGGDPTAGVPGVLRAQDRSRAAVALVA